MTKAFESCFKLSGVDSVAVEYPHVYWSEHTTGPGRIVMVPQGPCLRVFKSLAEALGSPQMVLYVLLVSRLGRDTGRYQSDQPWDRRSISEFLDEFGEYLDRDARHQLWLARPGTGDFLVWDNHQWIYAYGDLDRWAAVAQHCGLQPGRASIPVPHCHNYHPLFDATEEEVLDRFRWIRTPLQDQDDP